MKTSKNILVLGELCEDVSIIGKIPRISPECPALVFSPKEKKVNFGMAGNVYNNLKSLNQNNYNIEIINQDGKPISKTRYIDESSGYILLRVDENDVAAKLSRKINCYNLDCIVISDYGKGFLSEDDIFKISYESFKREITTFLDTKKVLGEWSKYVDFVKINEKEYNYNLYKEPFPAKYCKNLIVTFGGEGAKLFDSNNETLYHSKVDTTQVRDVCGAGDSFLAALCLNFLDSNNIFKSMDYANEAAAFAVSQKGIVSVDWKSLT